LNHHLAVIKFYGIRDSVFTKRESVGPKTFRFDEFVRLVAKQIRSRSRVIHLPTPVGFFLVRCGGLLVGDVVLTKEEVGALMANLLVSSGPATAPTRFTDWLAENAEGLGTQYVSEVRRNFSHA